MSIPGWWYCGYCLCVIHILLFALQGRNWRGRTPPLNYFKCYIFITKLWREASDIQYQYRNRIKSYLKYIVFEICHNDRIWNRLINPHNPFFSHRTMQTNLRLLLFAYFRYWWHHTASISRRSCVRIAPATDGHCHNTSLNPAGFHWCHAGCHDGTHHSCSCRGRVARRRCRWRGARGGDCGIIGTFVSSMWQNLYTKGQHESPHERALRWNWLQVCCVWQGIQRTTSFDGKHVKPARRR